MTTAASGEQLAARNAVWSDINFRWLMAGGALSMVGDQFTLIALPWLVLKLGGTPFSLGLVIALVGVPRALFILVGGALVDRYSPRRVMMLSKQVNALLLAVLAGLTLSGQATLALVYLLALALGLAQAFAIPSGTAILAQAMPPHLLQAANGAMMGLRQLALLAGPLLAALLLAFDSSSTMLGLAFALNALTFAVSAWSLTRVRPRGAAARSEEAGVLDAIGAGLALVWNDRALRGCFLYWAVVALFLGGVTQVALPLLARDVLHGASSYGVLMGVHGAGMLAGMALSGLLPRLALPFGALVLACDMIAGVLIAPLGLVGGLWQACTLLLLLGVLSGCMQVASFTWVQQRVPPHMLGRTMALFLFIFLGLAPLSAAATGALLQYVPLPALCLACGAARLAWAGWAWLFTPMRLVGAAAVPTPPLRA